MLASLVAENKKNWVVACSWTEMEASLKMTGTYEALCTIWYHLHNIKNAKNTDGGVLLKSAALLIFI